MLGAHSSSKLGSALGVMLACGLGAVGCDKPTAEIPEQPDPTAAPAADDGQATLGGGAEAPPGEAEAPGDEPGAGHEPPEPTPPTEDKVSDVDCESDSDCVQNACCHADSCVAATDAPTCTDTVCTLDCKAGTMDCGGSCACQDGKCVAKVVTSWGGDAPQ